MEEHLLLALECLERAASADDTLVSASRALSAALAASVAEPYLRRFFPVIASNLCLAIGRATPVLARAISGEIPTEVVEVGLRALTALASESAGADLPNRQLQVGLLSSELNALHCRRELAKRGIWPSSSALPLNFSLQPSPSLH